MTRHTTSMNSEDVKILYTTIYEIVLDILAAHISGRQLIDLEERELDIAVMLILETINEDRKRRREPPIPLECVENGPE